MYECSYSRILTSDDKIKASLNESPGGFIVRVTVIAVSTSKLTVRYGDSIGSITQAEITGQQLFPLMVAYHVGDKVECVIKEFKEITKRFRASVIALYPNGFRDLVKGVAIDDYMKVIVCTNTKVGVRVRIPKNNTILYGLVPHEEIRMDADAWCSKWKDDYVLVKCIGINYESGHIYFSRKQVLAENVED
jgi:ribosomal protein S1